MTPSPVSSAERAIQKLNHRERYEDLALVVLVSEGIFVHADDAEIGAANLDELPDGGLLPEQDFGDQRSDDRYFTALQQIALVEHPPFAARSGSPGTCVPGKCRARRTSICGFRTSP